jgi:hypothetical protein
MEQNEPKPDVLGEEQRRRATALMTVTDLGRPITPLGRLVTKFTPWELVYLADYVLEGAKSEGDKSIVCLPRVLAAHAVMALSMSPDEEDQACARRIEAALAVGIDTDAKDE